MNLQDEEWLKKEKKLNKLISDAVSFREGQRDSEYINNEAHYEGLHWNLAENKVDSPFLLRSDINHLKNAVDLRLGSLFADKYWGELMPLSPNDVDAVKDLNVLYKNEWNRLNADDFVEYVIKRGAICDNGYVQINYDPYKIIGGTQTRREGVITLEEIETSNVYLDPTASNIDECEYMVVKSHKSKKWIKSHKPEWLPVIEELNITKGDAGDTSQQFIGRDYSKANENSFAIKTVYIKEVTEIDMEVQDDEGNTVGRDKVPRTQIKEYYFIGDKLVGFNDEYPFDEFPIIAFQWEPSPQTPYGIPLLRGLTIPQKVANLIESAANNIAMHYTVPTWLVSASSGIDINKFAKLNNALGMAWKVNEGVNDAVKQLDPPQINADLIGIKDSFVQNIKNHAGISDTYIGNIGTAGSTAEGTNAAVSRATVIDNAPTKQIQKFVEKLSRMIVKYMVRYYKGETLYIRDTDKEHNSYNWNTLVIDDNFENMNFEFSVDLASRSKSDKNRQYNILKDLYQTQNQYKEEKRVINIPDLVQAANLDNFDEMYKRYKDMSEDAFAEKADLITQLLSIAQTITPNGTPLISAEEIQEGMMDILDDNGDLSFVEGLFSTYEEYQTKIAELNNQYAAMQNKTEADNYINASNDQSALMQQLAQGRDNIIQNGLLEESVKE